MNFRLKLSRLVVMVFLLISCSEKDQDQEKVRLLVNLTIDLAKMGEDLNAHKDLFKKYGYSNLEEGLRSFNLTFQEIKKDPEKYKLYQEQLLELIKVKQ